MKTELPYESMPGRTYRTVATHWSLLLVLGLALAGCNQPKTESGQADQPPEPPEPMLSTPAPATPAPEQPKPVVSATPEPPMLAPEGVYFLLAATSVETSDGIVGLKPGTQVQRVSPGKYIAGAHQVSLRDDQVTNDMRLARRVAGQEAAAQAAIRQSIAPRPAATPREVPRGTPREPARPVTAAPAGDPQLKNIEVRRIALMAELDRILLEQQKMLASRQFKRSWEDFVKNSPIAAGIEKRRAEVDKALLALNTEEQRIRALQSP